MASLLVCAADATLPLLDLPLVLQWWLLLEAGFFVLSQAVHRLDFKADPPMAPGERLEIWRRCCEESAVSAEEFITGWFYYLDDERRSSVPPLDALRRDDVLEFISWTAFNTEPQVLDAAQQSELELALQVLERRLGLRFPEGGNPQLGSRRLNLETPFSNIKPRPLFYYAVTDAIIGGLLTPTLMRTHGFTSHNVDGLTYWYRSPSGDTPGKGSKLTPLVFVHGVGIGPLPYLSFIEMCSPDAPILVLTIPWASQRLSGGVAPNSQETVDAIGVALERHGIKAATFVGHSLGSVYLSWVARLNPSIMASAVFIDPIVFMLHHCKVAGSFLYEQQKDTLFQVEKYFIKSEQRIVSYFHRRFYWYNSNLWADNLVFPTSIVLSGGDAIVPVDEVRRYFRFNPWTRLTVLPDAKHGEFLVNAAWRSSVVEQVRLQQRAGWKRAGVSLPLVSDLQERMSEVLPPSVPKVSRKLLSTVWSGS